jgi:type II secretory pathway component PulM
MSLAQAWHDRPERERRALAIGAAILGAILVVGLVWVPLERVRVRLNAELPRLRASIAVLERDAAEVRRMRSLAPVAAPAAAPMSTPRDLAGAQVSVGDDKRVHVRGDDVSFTALLDWLATAQSSQGLRVESARIEALAAPGRVRADLKLAGS